MEALQWSQRVLDPEDATLTEVAQLFKLLDRYLLLQGKTLTSYNINSRSSLANVGALPANTSQTDVPVSLQYFPERCLADHLDDLEKEREGLERLTNQISYLCHNVEIFSLAKSQLVVEYSHVRPDADIGTFSNKGVPEMLALLRAEQKRPVEEHPLAASIVETVSLKVVTWVGSTGKVSQVDTLELPVRASWKQCQDQLTELTKTWQAKEAGYPNGYSLRDGKWLYQTCKGSLVEKPMHDLATAQEYKDMRSLMDKTVAQVLIWHEQVLKASQNAIAEFERDEKMWPESQPLNDNGTALFGSLDLSELPDLMKNDLNAEDAD